MSKRKKPAPSIEEQEEAELARVKEANEARAAEPITRGELLEALNRAMPMASDPRIRATLSHIIQELT